MANLGHKIAPNTVKWILKEHGIEPAPFRRRRTTWAQFLRSHWDTLAAADFFTTEIWTPAGLVFAARKVEELRNELIPQGTSEESAA